ncbi:hypothetical protein BK675_05120 [Pseudomonas fluorescens]|nr:hypothetical protein BK677_15185 [Pseudomonas fluorescens]ROO10485.1 hypothetical protein BK675_05120 [Pseudomonas fluorescens]ROO14663.1 hypothetical protein BK676_22125 [Pseudomonas fluorescens]
MTEVMRAGAGRCKYRSDAFASRLAPTLEPVPFGSEPAREGAGQDAANSRIYTLRMTVAH